MSRAEVLTPSTHTNRGDWPNWFEMTGREHFEFHLSRFIGQPNLKYLQLGVFTGDASVWLMEKVLTHGTSRLVDVDTWEGSDEHDAAGWDWEQIRDWYWQNVGLRYEGVVSYWMTTREFFRQNKDEFDFVYIDAAHDAVSVMEDAVNAYSVLKVGGLLAFDDYVWQHPSGSVLGSPGIAIDMVKYLYAGKLQLLSLDSQCWMVKVG